MHHLSEQEIVRRESLVKIRELGIDPYPAEMFYISNLSDEIKENYCEEILEDGTKNRMNFHDVSVAGRLMAKREAGKALFLNIQDSGGRIQVYIRKEEICPEGEDTTLFDQVIMKHLDIGDYIGINGFVFKTKTGETTVHAKGFKLLSKSLKPLPIVKVDAEGNVFDAFSDPEMRYRQRYVDLTVNTGVKDIFIKRSKLIHSMRNYFVEQGWLEVETPILQPIHGGAAARPFQTHHNSLDTDLYMRIANELYLKRLIVGGFDGVFEFGKMFRNEGMDRTHNPEFTSMEIYVAYKDYIWMMDMIEKCIENVCIDVVGSTNIHYQGNEISFQGPYERLTMYESIQKYTGIDISEMDEAAMQVLCNQLHIHIDDTMGRGKLIDEIFGAKVEKNLIQPTFITDYPIEMTPLAKKHRSKEGLVERFELFVNGKEIANAYSELNDPIDQRERFEEQLKLAARGDEEAMVLDEDFLRALEYGMPPTSGLGIGIDRLTMLLTNQQSIQEVLFFPQMRPEKVNEMTEDEKLICSLVDAKIFLSIVKEKTGFSGKKWDSTIKNLTSKGFLKVTKTDEGLFLEKIKN